MQKNRMILRILAIVASLGGAAMVLWALSTPLLARRESTRLVDEARSLLSPPIKGLMDLDAVDCDRAEAMLRRASDLTPTSGDVRRELTLAEGCSAVLRGDLVLAEGGLRSAARRLPNDPRPQRWLGALAFAQDRLDDARRYYRRGMELDPNHLPSRVGLSDTLAELGQPEAALEMLEPANEAGLGLIETRRGILLEQLDRTEEAGAAYRRAMELSPDMAEPRNNLAALERDQGNLDVAWRLQQEAIELSPDDPVLLLNAGLLGIARGDDEEALSFLRRGAELDRETADCARAMADHLLVLGRAEETLDILSPAVMEHPRDAALRNTLGNALAAMGREAEARSAYEAAIEANSRLAEPHNGLAALMLAADDLTGAERELERALQLSPQNSQARRNLAELQRRQGELDGAEREQRLAQAVNTPSTSSRP